MKCFLLNLEIQGSKSFDEKISIDFFKKNIDIDKLEEFKNYKIKGIYGENGSGKTAIIDALKVLKGCVLDRTFVIEKKAMLKDIINQKTNFISIKVVGITFDKRPIIFEYEIKIEKEENEIDKYFISYESLTQKRLNLNAKGKNIYTIENNLLKTNISEIKKFNKVKVDSYSNSTLLNQYTHSLFKNNSDNKIDLFASELNVFLITTQMFFYSIKVYEIDLVEREENYLNLNIDSIYNIESYIKLISLKLNQNVIYKKDIDKLIVQTKKLENFIKLFKPTLKEIYLKQSFNDDVIKFERIFIYQNGVEISESFESTGIKKLSYYFSAIQDLLNGNIVVIDELDSNIHQNALNKLIDFIKIDETGQLVFTAHNLNVLEQIHDLSKSIDFITSDSKIVSWTKNGNYSVSNVYIEGFVPGIPFNLNSLDFFPVFYG